MENKKILVAKVEALHYNVGNKVKQFLFDKNQSVLTNNIASGLAGKSLPFEKDRKYFIILYKGTETECQDKEIEVLDKGSLRKGELIVKVNELRVPRLVKSNMIALINKSECMRKYVQQAKQVLFIQTEFIIINDKPIEELKEIYF
jgi:hypothetical protein